MTPAPGRDDTTGAGDESASYGVSVESANPQVRTVVRPMSEVVTLAALARRGFEGKSSWMDAADAILAAGWTPPAATPGRDELREQIAAALAQRFALAHAEIAVEIVMEPVDAWVAAHTAEARDGWQATLDAALRERGTYRAAVARVRALGDEWWGRATEATSEPLSWRSVTHELRAALPPTEQT